MNEHPVHQVDKRHLAIDQTVNSIRQIQQSHGISRESLRKIKAELIALSKKKDLFALHEFPPPNATASRNSCLYRLAEDVDHRFALYLNVACGVVDTPAHDHTTWAVVVGIEGHELNHFYRGTPNTVEQVGTEIVSANTGVAMLAEDLHSIHICGATPVINFHMYGLALEQLHNRRYFDAESGNWKHFPAHTDIREARGSKRP